MFYPSAEPRGFVHYALLYRSEQEYLQAAVPYIIEGLAADEPVMVAVPRNNLEPLRNALGDAAAQVAMADMTELGRNPGHLLGALGSFAANHPKRRVRVLGECIWPDRSAGEYAACVQHEAFSNSALHGFEMTGLCPYNVSGLDEHVVADARATHPLLWQSGSLNRSPDYAPGDAFARYNQPLPRNPGAVECMVRSLSDLLGARSFAARYAGWVGLSQDAVAELQLIVTELATNSMRHTGGICRLGLWIQDGQLVCEARDRGPFAERPPGCGPPRVGSGLFLINAMADLVRTHTAPTSTTIQVYLRLDRRIRGNE